MRIHEKSFALLSEILVSDQLICRYATDVWISLYFDPDPRIPSTRLYVYVYVIYMVAFQSFCRRRASNRFRPVDCGDEGACRHISFPQFFFLFQMTFYVWLVSLIVSPLPTGEHLKPVDSNGISELLRANGTRTTYEHIVKLPKVSSLGRPWIPTPRN